MKIKPEWQELAINAQPCPKCGNPKPHYRHSEFYNEKDAVCCSGEGCNFYQASTSREEALAKWNNANADTPVTQVHREDAFPDKEIIGHLTFEGSPCAYCQCRKEKYPGILPQECQECGFLSQRDKPYCSEVPVYKDDAE